MKTIKLLVTAAAALCALAASLDSQAQAVSPKREMRGVWVSTHLSMDWPNRTQTPAQQRAALITILEHNKASGMNALFLQVRSQSDAMYAGSSEPWSYYLTNQQGQAPNPAWDPLQFAIEEVRKRGMEIHAWVNPYRAVANTAEANDAAKFAANHVSKLHPEWLLTLGTVRILNPGLPAVREYVHEVVMDIVNRYDIDGLHFDDYFYQTGTIDDAAAYAADPRGFPATTAGRNDWRRDNVSLLISRLGQSIREAKPWVKFGISPSGIYKSDPAYPGGTPNPANGSWTSTGAFQHYSSSYADTRLWLQSGWLDYLAPQVYWYIGQTGSDYQNLIPWWSGNTFGRHMYIGLADYKMNTTGWTAPNPDNMIAREIGMNRVTANIAGQVHFRHAFLASNPLGYRTELMNTQYRKPALLPTMPWKSTAAPAAPTALAALRSGNASVALSWTAPADGADEFQKTRRYAVYRAASLPVNLEDPLNLVGLTPAGETAFTDTGVAAGQYYHYAVTALNRLHNESAASAAASDDSVPPTVLTQAVARPLAGGALSVAPADFDAGSSDNWGIASLSLDRTQFSCADIGLQSLQLTATDKAGLSSSAAAALSVQGAVPQAAITPTRAGPATGYPANTVTLGVGAQSLTLSASDAAAGSASSYAWTPAPGLTGINGATAQFTPTAAGTYVYQLRATNQYGCTADASVTVVAIDKRRVGR